MTAVPNKELVLVEFEYEYTGRDGGLVSIKPNERYILLAKTNDHWWHVRKDERTKPFYIPAKYVKELPSDFPSPLDFICPSMPKVPENASSKKPIEMVEERPGEVTIRVRPQGNYKKAENRMSTFGVPLDLHDPVLKRGGHADSVGVLQPHSCESTTPSACTKDGKRFNTAPSASSGSRPLPDDLQQLALKSRVPSFSPADPVIRPIQAKPVEPPVIKDIEVQEPLETPKPPAGFEDPPGPDSDLSQDSENIYESIADIQDLRLTESPVRETAPPLTPAPAATPAPVLAPAQPPPPPAPSQTEKTKPSTAVYVNISDLKKIPQSTPSVSSASGASCRLSLDSEGWEVHTDQESGQEYYYHPATGQSTWDNPRSPLADPESPLEARSSPSPVHSPSPSPSVPSSGGSDWERLLDEASGRHYFYNHVSRETSWVPPELASPSSPVMEPQGLQKPRDNGPPPLPEEDYPLDDHEEPRPPLTFPKDLPQIKRAVIPRASVDTNPPVGWTRSLDPEGKTVFTSDRTLEQWIMSVDERGQTYYYLRDGSRSQWNLPELSGAPGQLKVGNGVDPEGVGVLKNWRHTMSPSPNKDDVKFFPNHRRNVSDYASDASSSGNSPELSHHADRFKHRRNPSNQSSDSQQQHAQILEKAGIVNKTKIAENGKRLRKNWAPSWTVLHGGILTFHKDPKSTPTGTTNKTNQIVPEYTVELRGATINWASKDKSSKKHVLELKTRHGSEYLMQYDTESIISDWLRVITDSIRQLDMDHHSEEEDDEGSEKSPAAAEKDDKDKKKNSTRQSVSGPSADSEQGRVRTKLRKFLQRRPTLQSVKEKGYIRDSVFGCHLDTLCMRENTTIPSFVEKCIKSVEKRGLNIDGIYRVSGNLAVIQKLRHKADHEENLDLEDGQWEEIHVITGALKLFFRELSEPLFPFSHFDGFIAAIKLGDYSQRVSYMHDLVKTLPLPNHDTMELLFRHLRKVIEFGEVNRMSVQSVAIVFGPTLLRPETESANITMHMVFQNQIVELILNEYDKIFRPD
ncbi:rho GTPase-activating protein 27-like [Megalops cyprinoides]|uniref:rho GTPase-activating protein 27-like n=1 Tax=Megalops cyprinoides TaxID=118141 RepID=UPI001864A9FC|nr:rho GTPase-activating protein 27-like [Megalops cyprinoides]